MCNRDNFNKQASEIIKLIDKSYFNDFEKDKIKNYIFHPYSKDYEFQNKFNNYNLSNETLFEFLNFFLKKCDADNIEYEQFDKSFKHNLKKYLYSKRVPTDKVKITPNDIKNKDEKLKEFPIPESEKIGHYTFIKSLMFNKDNELKEEYKTILRNNDLDEHDGTEIYKNLINNSLGVVDSSKTVKKINSEIENYKFSKNPLMNLINEINNNFNNNETEFSICKENLIESEVFIQELCINSDYELTEIFKNILKNNGLNEEAGFKIINSVKSNKFSKVNDLINMINETIKSFKAIKLIFNEINEDSSNFPILDYEKVNSSIFIKNLLFESKNNLSKEYKIILRNNNLSDKDGLDIFNNLKIFKKYERINRIFTVINREIDGYEFNKNPSLHLINEINKKINENSMEFPYCKYIEVNSYEFIQKLTKKSENELSDSFKIILKNNNIGEKEGFEIINSLIYDENMPASKLIIKINRQLKSGKGNYVCKTDNYREDITRLDKMF
jgi:hypothetical protein